MRIFKTKWMARYARRERIADHSLNEAIGRAGRGMIDADLGGGIIKLTLVLAVRPYRCAGCDRLHYGFCF